MLTHSHKNEFLAAVTKKYIDLKQQDIFHHVVKITVISKLLSLMWVFIYKFNINEFLSKFKTQICVCSDFQKLTHHDIYAVTLTDHIFWALMTIAAVFNLKMYQWDAVNIFMNSEMKKTVYCDCLKEFDRSEMCLLLLQVLYDLQIFSLFWLKEFSKILQKLDLQQINEKICLFQNDWLLVFFYMNDIVILCCNKNLFKMNILKTALKSKYEMRFMNDLKWFLRICIICDCQ